MKLRVLLILLSFCCTIAHAQIVTDGLVGYWTFDNADIKGDEVSDVWGNNHGKTVGAPKSIAGKVGEAVQFNGSSDWMEIPRHESLQFDTNAVTMAVWVKTLGGEDDWIIYDGNAGRSGYALVLDNRDGKDSFGISFWNEAGVRHNILGDAKYRHPMDEWHYVVGVLDGNKMRKYVNGTLEAETDFAGKIRKNAVDPVHIARYGFAGGYFVNGALDELTIYAKALSDAEIQINFTAEGLATQVQPRGKLPTVWATLKRQNGLGR